MPYLNIFRITSKKDMEVLLYILLYTAFFGERNIPSHLGIFTPREWAIYLFGDILAEIIFFSEGFRIPNFILRLYLNIMSYNNSVAFLLQILLYSNLTFFYEKLSLLNTDRVFLLWFIFC